MNGKADALSQLYAGQEEVPHKPESILPKRCFINTITWILDQEIREHPSQANMP